jgi:predicted NBD/HSP70 family sugar kinase
MVSTRSAFASASTDSAGLRSETVRSANLATVLSVLHFGGPTSRSEMVARTGLTRSAIGALVGELVRTGLVVERRAISDGSPGRPSPVASVVGEQNVALAVEVLVDSIGVAAVGLGGLVLHSFRIDRPRDRVSVERTIDDIVETVGRVRGHLAPSCRVVGMGVGVVGIVRRSDNSVTIAPNLGWHEVAFGEQLAAAFFHEFPVLLSNDADAAALAEVRRGAAMGIDDAVCIWGEVGVGGGLISRGEPVTGASGFAGEVGHMPVNPDGRPCQCGSFGCWETEIGEGSLLRRTGRPPDGGRAAVDAVLRDAVDGVPAALEALAVEARWLGIGLSGLINVLNPSMVILGGLFGRLHPLIAPQLNDEIARRALPSARARLLIVPSSIGADAVLLGAAELAFEAVLTDPLGTLDLRFVAGGR